jgi:putative MFS transporter
MASAPPTTDHVNYDRFQNRVAATASGGKFCDGWILAVIGVALPLASTQLGFSPTMEGLIGSSSLFGIFIGGLAFGALADKLGRKKMFMVTLLLFLVCSVLQLFTVDAWSLFVLRLIMGIAIGADYAIGGSLIAEFTSTKRRGPKLAQMMVWWYGGFALSATVFILLMNALPDVTWLWRVALASSALPALVMFLLRIGMPESPRWLAGHGHKEEAQRIAERYLDPRTRIDALAEQPSSGGFKDLFSREHLRKTLLTSLFWMAQVTPFFAIYVFLPRLLDDLGIHLGAWSEVVLYIFLFIGAVGGSALINSVGRRKMLLWTFVGMGLPLLLVGLWSSAPLAVIGGCFILFSLSHAAGSTLQMLYPSEIFPTEIRATGVGFAAAMSRIGSAVSTFLMPIGLIHWGVGPVMLVGVLVIALGFLVSVLWAPETRNLELTETSSLSTVPAAPQPHHD